METSGRVAEALASAVAGMSEGRDVAVAFSGGVDSSLVAALAARSARSVRLYVAGTEGSADVEAAERLAPETGAELTVVPMDESSVIEGLRSQIAVTGTASPLTLAFELPMWHVLRACSEKTVLAGQGSDELFLGYRKYAGLPRDDLARAREEDLRRLDGETEPHEARMAASFGKEIGRPYLSDGVRGLILSLPTEEVDPAGDASKALLRSAARELGLAALAERPKKAAQYGSGAIPLLKRIAKSKGLEYNALVAELAAEARNL